MRLLVLGASGGTGRQLVAQALAAGHDVRAFVRDGGAFGGGAPGLEVVAGDAMDPQAVSGAVAGRDGPRSDHYAVGYFHLSNQKLTRSDLAAFMLSQLADDRWLRQAPMLRAGR